MPYALFSNAVKVSKSFATKAEVWKHAEASGFVVEVRSYEEDPPRRTLHMGHTIQEVPPDAEQPASTLAGHGVAKLIAGACINPPSAAAAS